MVRKVTAQEVAERAGVSRAAVSRAFRADRSLSDDKRARVLEAARTLGYASPSAQAIASVTTGTITLVAGDLENPFYPVAATELSQAIHAAGRRLILHTVPPDEDVDAVLEQVLDYRSDAAIVTSAHMSSRIARTCREAGMPVILFNRVQPDAAMTAVTCDNFAGGRMAAHHFASLGRRRIAMIGGSADTSTHLERSRGFRDALDALDLPLFATTEGAYRYDVAFAAAQTMFTATTLPDAVFALNDVMALAAVDAAREVGLSVPDDIAIIGFDDIPMAAWPSYRLTTIRQPLRRMVAETLALIDAQKADPDMGGTIRVLPVEMMRRDTA
ncbi:MAG: LacI family DNA-binding transcriptional regulator [Pseudomonadota bacterium]|nr:LacI family DNA-binding transcriptional regulator [Pseudomonadota bacterium]